MQALLQTLCISCCGLCRNGMSWSVSTWQSMTRQCGTQQLFCWPLVPSFTSTGQSWNHSFMSVTTAASGAVALQACKPEHPVTMYRFSKRCFMPCGITLQGHVSGVLLCLSVMHLVVVSTFLVAQLTVPCLRTYRPKSLPD